MYSTTPKRNSQAIPTNTEIMHYADANAAAMRPVFKSESEFLPSSIILGASFTAF